MGKHKRKAIENKSENEPGGAEPTSTNPKLHTLRKIYLDRAACFLFERKNHALHTANANDIMRYIQYVHESYRMWEKNINTSKY